MGALSGPTKRSATQIVAAGLTGGIIGAAGGAAVASAVGADTSAGLALGAVTLGVVSAWADARRIPGHPQPAWVRILAAAFVAAVAGWLLDVVLPAWPAWIPYAIIGAGTGAAGFRPDKVLLGAIVGAGVGLVFDLTSPETGWAVPVAATVVVYRSVAVWWWRGRDQVRIMGEGMAVDQARYVVPFVEASAHVGVDYLERYARSVGARFIRDPPDIGIVESLDLLRGPGFDPDRAHPLIREFYEHTSRFTLSIVPEWKPWMRWPYRIYRATVARPLGQANAPFEIEEVQRGVVSWIDTIDVDHDGVTDLRAWIRAYQDGEPLYVGIYTVQEIDDVAYVAVGFPVPAGNFTATLAPANNRGDGLLLRSQADAPYAGHYLSFMDDAGLLTTLQLSAFGEEIDVFVSDGRLKTEHRFFLGGIPFLTLHYDMARK
jgi:hypothetical protein